MKNENLMKTFLRTFCLMTMLVITATICVAAPPTNDNLANAQILVGASGTVSGTSVDATREPGEYEHLITSGQAYRTVWFTWTPTESKPAVFEITSSEFDSTMAVYAGAVMPLSSRSVNNDTNGQRPRIEFEAIAGTTYSIVIGLYGSNADQGGAFSLQWSTNNAPTNDNFASAMVLPAGLSGSVAVSNQNATKESGEPSHYAGNQSVWFKFTNNQPFDYSMSFTTRQFSGGAINTTIAVYTGSSLDSLTALVKNDNRPTTNVSEARFLAKSGVTYMIALDGGLDFDEWSSALNWDINKIKDVTDFGTRSPDSVIHYDNAADLTVFRPSTGTWWIRNSHIPTQVRAFRFGQSGDVPVQGDYDGDGITDLAVARDTPQGKVWYVANSFDGSYTIFQWGLTGDKPVTGDYDADGRVDFAVFRPSTGVWYIRKSTDGGFIIRAFGLDGDIPVSGHFKGTPAGSDIAVYRPSNGTWYILNTDHTIFIPFGLAGDQPTVADYDNDGYSDVAVFRPTTGTWYTLRSQAFQVVITRWGLDGDIPMAGNYDYNANVLGDFAVFRPSESRWYVLSAEGAVTQEVPFGLPGDIPASSINRLAQ